jgi:uncharacterized protein YecE (DUF72 family)
MHFRGDGSQLERYASRLAAVEINSSFYRPHRPSTYARWADSVPKDFRFSVKVPKEITHTRRLSQCDEPITAFLEEVGALREKLGCLLVQLPPSLALDQTVASAFFEFLHDKTRVPIACEPRHASWFEPGGDALLRDLRIARVAADPAKLAGAAEPGGWRGFTYYRLHGSPKMYYSLYSSEVLATLALRLREDLAEDRLVWCIFDNTASGAAVPNALDLLGLLTE